MTRFVAARLPVNVPALNPWRVFRFLSHFSCLRSLQIWQGLKTIPLSSVLSPLTRIRARTMRCCAATEAIFVIPEELASLACGSIPSRPFTRVRGKDVSTLFITCTLHPVSMYPCAGRISCTRPLPLRSKRQFSLFFAQCFSIACVGESDQETNINTCHACAECETDECRSLLSLLHRTDLHRYTQHLATVTQESSRSLHTQLNSRSTA